MKIKKDEVRLKNRQIVFIVQISYLVESLLLKKKKKKEVGESFVSQNKFILAFNLKFHITRIYVILFYFISLFFFLTLDNISLIN